MRISEKHSTDMLCPDCGGPMAQSHVELAIYRRVFKCVACGHCDRVHVTARVGR
jgi:hypothetical protein